MTPGTPEQVSLSTIAREWGRIGITGFGGPPAHIALLPRLWVKGARWLPATEFEDAIAAVNLLPGPASTQLAIFCAWRLRGQTGAVLSGVCFIVPGLIIILCLSALFLAAHPPLWIEGAAAGAGAAVPSVAVQAAIGLAPASWKRTGDRAATRARWVVYLLLGGAAAATIGPYLVVVLLACGLVEITSRRAGNRTGSTHSAVIAVVGHAVALGGFGSLASGAFKVGALSYGGGFVIVPLMQHDAVSTYHWMTGTQFLNAVALGQITPGPVVQTVAVVGYAAAGVGGALLAALVAFAPSFALILGGARHFGALRANRLAQGFLGGAGPAAIGAIAGASIPLALAIAHVWQVEILAGALVLI